MLQASAPQKRHSPGLLPRSSPAALCAPTAVAAKSPRPPSTARRLVVREQSWRLPSGGGGCGTALCVDPDLSQRGRVGYQLRWPGRHLVHFQQVGHHVGHVVRIEAARIVLGHVRGDVREQVGDRLVQPIRGERGARVRRRRVASAAASRVHVSGRARPAPRCRCRSASWSSRRRVGAAVSVCASAWRPNAAAPSATAMTVRARRTGLWGRRHASPKPKGRRNIMSGFSPSPPERRRRPGGARAGGTARTSPNRRRRRTISSMAARMAPAANSASSAGKVSSYRDSTAHRSSIQCHAVCATNAERMIVPIRSATACRNSQFSAGTASARTNNCPSSTPRLNDSSDAARCAPANCMRLAQREGEAEAVHESEPERHQPPPLQLGAHDVLDRHVYDRRRDQHLDERREPQGARRESARRRDECDRMRDGERGHDRDQRAEAAERDHQTEQKQQVVGAARDVLEAEQRRSAPRPDTSSGRGARARDRRGTRNRARRRPAARTAALSWCAHRGAPGSARWRIASAASRIGYSSSTSSIA